MKKGSLAIMLLGLAIAACMALGGGPTAKTTLAIKGMSCGGCVAAVEDQLKKTEGVTSYEVSLERAEAEVTYELANTTPEKIAESVSKTGRQASVKKSVGDEGGEAAAR